MRINPNIFFSFWSLQFSFSNKESKSEQPSLLRTTMFGKGWLSLMKAPARLFGDFTDAQWTLGHCRAAKDWHLVSKISTPSVAKVVDKCGTYVWKHMYDKRVSEKIINPWNNHEHKVESYRPCDRCKGKSFMAFSSKCSCIDLSLIHIWRCRRSTLCRSRWSPYH